MQREKMSNNHEGKRTSVRGTPRRANITRTNGVGPRQSSMPSDPKRGVPYVHMFPRKFAKGVPNISPFAMKLETWLRMHNISYEVVETTKLSSGSNQIPYIIMDSVEHTDSNLIIDMLMERNNVELSEGLTQEQQAISRAFIKMLDEHTSWTYLLHRSVYHSEEFFKYYRPHHNRALAKTVSNGIRNSIRRRADSQGIGLKSRDQVTRLGIEDIRAVSRFLGDKKYMFGDQPTKVDCTVFGHLCQVMYMEMPCPHKDFIKSECPNIARYLDTIKSEFWSDWDSLCQHGTFD